MTELKIGSTVYLFDLNHRVYPTDENGKRIFGVAPIYREHFAPRTITGENNRSWIINQRPPIKINKKAIAETGRDGNIFADWNEIEKDIWMHDHRHKIIRELQFKHSEDYDLYQKIATMIGYNSDD
jgi:hypothetical protein